jgi:acetyltransferase-like isoleucine patch superfamily enzyme
MPFKDKHGRALSTQEATQKIVNRFASIWLEFVTGWLWWKVGEVPLHNFRKFFYRLAGVKIGKGSTIHMRVRIYDPRNIIIGEDSIIGERVVLDGRAKLTIGNHVDIATGAMIFNSQHDINSPDFAPIEAENVIEDYVFIGPNAIILPGIKIGKGAVVAAGAVVTKDVAPMQVVAGVPAKEISTRKVSELKYKLGRARWFQ